MLIASIHLNTSEKESNVVERSTEMVNVSHVMENGAEIIGVSQRGYSPRHIMDRNINENMEPELTPDRE